MLDLNCRALSSNYPARLTRTKMTEEGASARLLMLGSPSLLARKAQILRERRVVSTASRSVRFVSNQLRIRMAPLPYDICRNTTFIGFKGAKDIIRDVTRGRRTKFLACHDRRFSNPLKAKQKLRREHESFYECALSTQQTLVSILWLFEFDQTTHKGRRSGVMLADGSEQKTNPLDVALDGKLAKTAVKAVQNDLKLMPFRGPLGRAHAVRAQYYTALKTATASQTGGTVIVPPALGEKNRHWWARQIGRTAREIGSGEHAGINDSPADLRMDSAAREAEDNPPDPTSHHSRDAILQDVARFLHGRIAIARINGSGDGVAIQAYDWGRRRLLVEARWAPRRDIMDHFALEILSRQEARELAILLASNGGAMPSGRILTRERPHQIAGRDEFDVGHLGWSVIAGPESKPYFLTACKDAKAAKRDVFVGAVDGKLNFAVPGPYAYSRQDLEWLMRKSWTHIKVSDDGVIGVTVEGLVGKFRAYLCGVAARRPPSLDFSNAAGASELRI